MVLELRQQSSGWTQLAASSAVRQQQAAFACATGLPLTLLPASSDTGHPSPNTPDDAFCIDGCLGGRTGDFCKRALRQAEHRAAQSSEPVMFRCPAGVMKILVPVLAGGHHIGTLLAGPFSLKQPTTENLRRVAHRLHQRGLGSRAKQLDVTWQHTPIIDAERRRAVTTLVRMFADYLAECSNRVLLRQADHSSPLMQKIEAFLGEQSGGAVTLREVARRVSLSPCHFCRVFKKQTGLTFSEYRTRLRVEKVKQLLLKSDLRVSEVAFEAGFNSIPYFNRAFRRYVGCPPSEFRAKSAGANGVKRTTNRA